MPILVNKIKETNLTHIGVIHDDVYKEDLMINLVTLLKIKDKLPN